MTKRYFARAAATVLAALLGLGGVAAAESIDRVVRIEDVRSSGDVVRGRLVNETGDELQHVRLLVTDQFLWRNERHPGPESPSDAFPTTVSGPIPPHGSVAFEIRRPRPLPDRADGEFTTEVAAIEVTRFPPTTARSETYERTYERRTSPDVR